MIFRQLIDRPTCTYTYLLADPTTREAVLIDPVRDQIDRDVQLLEELGLELKYTLETHVHADHVTSSGLLRGRVGSQSVVSAAGGAPCADRPVFNGDRVHFGQRSLEVRSTPGHTNGCVSYVLDDEKMVFTGDTLLIRGCGRTDFQQGSAEMLYYSVREQLFSLPDTCQIYPGHDYKGRTSSTVVEERRHNPRLRETNSLADFERIMDQLKLAHPAQIDVAVPANLKCGWLAQDGEWRPPNARELGWAPVVCTPEGIPEVTTAYVADLPDEIRLIDVRRQEEFIGELGHVPGSELHLLDTLNAPAEAWDRNKPIVVVCRSGNRSGRAARLLESMGFAKVASMRGGMLQWNQEGRKTGR
jgi:glyoxylase-like metal-dependent hydrolase (beta-lactamase superfamily II)